MQKKILVVEDNHNCRELVVTQLQRMSDHHVIEAATGEEAIWKALAEIPDLIIMDLGLPVISGTEANLFPGLGSEPYPGRLCRCFVILPRQPKDGERGKPLASETIRACTFTGICSIGTGKGWKITRRRTEQASDS